MFNEFQIKNTNITQFDSIRFIFAMFVIIVHHQFSYANIPSAFAYLAMHIFFVMSAFLISRGLLLSKSKAQTFGLFFKDFYKKRILRIFPVYFAYLFFLIGISFTLYLLKFGDILKIITEFKRFGWMLFTFTYNYREIAIMMSDKTIPDFIFFSHLWSLSMEEQFYIVIPFVIYFMNRKQLVWLSVIAIIITPIFRVWYYENVLVHEQDYILKGLIYYRATFLQFDCFFYGILLATYNFKDFIKTYKVIFYLLLIVYLFVIIYNGFIISKEMNLSFFSSIIRYDFMILNKQYLYHDVLINWLIFFMFLNCFYNPKFLSFLNFKFILNAGNKFTYSSYVYQYLFILPSVGILYPLLTKVLGLTEVLAQLIALIVSSVGIYYLSSFSYKKMEIKFLNLLKKEKHAK